MCGGIAADFSPGGRAESFEPVVFELTEGSLGGVARGCEQLLMLDGSEVFVLLEFDVGVRRELDRSLGADL